MSDPGLLLVAELHGLAGREGELRALLADLAGSARAEPGCLGFRVLAADEPGEVVLLAAWRDEAALRAHYGTAAYRRYRGQVGPLLARPERRRRPPRRRHAARRRPEPAEPGMLG